MSNPSVSIITINLDNESGLRRTFESVFNQTYDDFEYIVIDGGSIDGSADLIDQYAEHITYAVSESDEGLYDAMNKGILVARGEYLLFLNSGDELYDQNVLFNVFSQTYTESFLFGDMVLVHKGGRRTLDKGPKTSDVGLLDMYLGTLNHPSTFIGREVFQKYGAYDTSISIVSDWKLFFVAIGLNLESVRYLDAPISVFYMGGISSQKKQIQKEREAVFRKYLPVGVLADYDSKLRLIHGKNLEHLFALGRVDVKLRRSKIVWFLHRVLVRLSRKAK